MSFYAYLHALAVGPGDEHELGHEVDRHAQANAHGFSAFVAGLGTWAKEHPGAILNFLRRVKPVLKVKNVCVVTSYTGCRYVLSESSDFGVVYADKMKLITEGDNFFLGMDDDEPAATTARSAMALVFRREDMPVIRDKIAGFCAQALADAGQRFDLVGEVLQKAPARFAIDYFGFKFIEARWLFEVTQTLFEYLFIDIENDPGLAAKAAAAAAALRAALEREIAAGGNGDPESVLGRALRLQSSHPAFSARDIRNNFIGLLIGLVPTTAKSAAMAFDMLTLNETTFAQTRAAAQGPFDAFLRLTREATRLNPINPGLFRIARRDAVIISDGRETPVDKGTLVFVGTSSAMRDERHVPDPLDMKTDRPESAYLTYGYGLHACFGRYINDLHVALLLRGVLTAGHVRRAEGADGDLHFNGPFPDRLVIEI